MKRSAHRVVLVLALTACSAARQANRDATVLGPMGQDGAAAGTAGGGGGSDAAGAPGGGAGGAGGGSPAGPCAALKLDSNVRVAEFDTDRISWQDSQCRPREAALVRVGGGYVRQFVYEVDGKPRVATGTGANGHTGWGYTVNHYGNTAALSRGLPGGFGALFVGPHHAVYQYTVRVTIASQSIPVTQHWFFATGRDHPVLATTFDASGVPPGTLGADNRTPYGDLAWDGDENRSSVPIDGVGWGDRYKFITTSAPLTMNSRWDYSQKNLVPYVLEWINRPDAEMGAVQTQTYLQRDGGGYWFYDNWGRTSDNAAPPKERQIGRMTPTWNWTYQLNQYELCIEDPRCLDGVTRSHRLAWGSNYGAIGGARPGSGDYPAYGDDRMLSGHPFQSHSVFMVLGKHSAAPVFRQVAEIETVQATRLAASAGTVKAMGPGGVGRTDLVSLAPAGYDHRYAVWNVEAAGNRVALRVTVESGALESPILVVSGYTAPAPPAVKVDGVTRAAGADYLLSHDPAGRQVWITFRAGWRGTQELLIE
jgi:hypothetical protein